MRSARAFEEPKRVCCAVSRCMTVVKPGEMMCLTHWLLVPRALQVEIGHTYRARQMGNYQNAYARAVDHVESATGVFTDIFEKPAKQEAVVPARPTKPIGLRVRRPRLTIKRLDVIGDAIMSLLSKEQFDEDLNRDNLVDALLWVRGEWAKRRARKAARL
jgi:hypothetical protein